MNDNQSQVVKQVPPPQMTIVPPPLPLVMNSVPTQLLSQSQPLNMAPSQALMNQGLMMKNRNYNHHNTKISSYQNSNNFASNSNQQPQKNRHNWKGKKGLPDKRQMNDPARRMDNLNPGFVIGGYKPPSLNELQSQNRMKFRKFYPKKFNNRFAPYAPRNTTSFIIRAKKSGGIAELVSPCPVTPAVLPTPILSPSREVLGDMAKEEWGVDGYGSMKGLIRLRSPGHEEEEDDDGGSSESDVEEHVEVERRLDHDLSRFEMIHPNYTGVEYNNGLENRVDDQDSHIAQLEEENLTLKERLFLMEREFKDLKRRLNFLERRNQVVVHDENLENVFENDSEGEGSDVRGAGSENNEEEMVEYVGRNEVAGENHKEAVEKSSIDAKKQDAEQIDAKKPDAEQIYAKKQDDEQIYAKKQDDEQVVAEGQNNQLIDGRPAGNEFEGEKDPTLA